MIGERNVEKSSRKRRVTGKKNYHDLGTLLFLHRMSNMSRSAKNQLIGIAPEPWREGKSRARGQWIIRSDGKVKKQGDEMATRQGQVGGSLVR